MPGWWIFIMTNDKVQMRFFSEGGCSMPRKRISPKRREELRHVSRDVLNYVVSGLVPSGKASDLAKALDYRTVKEFLEDAGVESLGELFFGGNFMVRMTQLRLEMRAIDLGYRRHVFCSSESPCGGRDAHSA